jgi:hypothetical protein
MDTLLVNGISSDEVMTTAEITTAVVSASALPA